MNILEVKNVYKQYANHLALNDVSISVPRGSIFGLLGPNGAGKTTLIRIINTITAPDKGEVLLNNTPLTLKHTANIGYLPEERGLYKKMKVGEQALYLCQLKGLSKTEALKRLKYWFEKFEIESWWDKKVEELSKGMAQKVQFITTVLHEPELLIFDEPFSGFDPINAELLKKEIIELKNKGATVIFSTHNMDSVERLCENIALINKSQVVLSGNINQIRKQFSSHKYIVTLKDYDPLPHNDFHCANLLNLKQENNITHAEFTLKDNNTSNDLLSELIQKSTILKFEEQLPSMNDIFLKTVNK
ncbi:MAG: ATP-binding cassette domain-containing protein [Paludibacteraceae bacterium]|nr:ATP-binding cassette domain-containing protein [Paludibacteraceae bacterium]